MVLLFVGMHAVSKGRFYETEDFDKISDVSIVPLAAPFIAGPGSITVSITIATQQGYLAMILSVALAVVANMLFMLCSPVLGKTLEKVHAIGPAVRITGLVVMAMAVQMILGGLSDWLRPVLR
jgi:multiple antibiotic resistance protein